jgi:hypothetical protein
MMTPMSAKVCVFFVGLVYVFFGVTGLCPSCVYPPPHQLAYYEMTIVGRWGYLFGWLPVNLPHDLLYLLIGTVAVIASFFRPTTILYARGTFFLMILLVFTGLLPFGLARLGGLIPLFDWNIMLHSVTAILLYYFGFIHPLDLGGKEAPSQMLVGPSRKAISDFTR